MSRAQFIFIWIYIYIYFPSCTVCIYIIYILIGPRTIYITYSMRGKSRFRPPVTLVRKWIYTPKHKCFFFVIEYNNIYTNVYSIIDTLNYALEDASMCGRRVGISHICCIYGNVTKVPRLQSIVYTDKGAVLNNSL